MKADEAIQAIVCNYPPSQYTMLREALDLAMIALKENERLNKENGQLKNQLQLICSKSVIPFNERSNIDPYDVIMDMGTVAESALNRLSNER